MISLRTRLWLILSVFFAFVLVFGIGLFTGYSGWPAKKAVQPAETVHAQTILTALKDQGFLVTQSIISTQEATIKRSTGSALKDFFVGQTIRARGTMETNLGVDLSQLSEEDVQVNGSHITVLIPATKLFNTRLLGDIEVENSQGIIKRVFQPDDGYNAALAELTSLAEGVAKDESILTNAQERSKEEIQRLVKLLLPPAARIEIKIKP